MDSGVQVGFGIIGLLTILVDLFAIITLSRRPSHAFDRAGKSKSFWLLVIIVGIFICNVGFWVSLWYLIIVDPKVRAQEKLGPGIGFPNH